MTSKPVDGACDEAAQTGAACPPQGEPGAQDPSLKETVSAWVAQDEKTGATPSQNLNGGGSAMRKVTVLDDPNDPDQVIIRTRKRRRTKRHRAQHLSKGKKVVLGVVAALVVLACAVAIAVAVLVHNGALSARQEFEGAQTPETVETTNGGQTIVHDGHTYQYNENVVTMLFLGVDDETNYGNARPDAKCADVNLLVSMDTETNDMTVVAIPRDSQVDVDRYDNGEYADTIPLQLCLAYSVDLNTEEECAENSVKSASRIFYSLPISYYFSMDEEAFVELSDAVGGVQVEALDTYPGANFSKGETVLLQGEDAWNYIHYRDINIDYSSLDRQERQVQFAKAFLNKLKKSNVKQLLKLYNVIQANTLTNLGTSELAYLASCFVSGGKGSISFTSIEGKTKFMVDADGVEREHVFLDDDSVLKATLAAYYTQVD